MIYYTNIVDPTTSFRYITVFELSQNAENEKYLNVKKWRESGLQKSKTRENCYQRIESAKKINEINKKVFKDPLKLFQDSLKLFQDPWQKHEEEIPWQREYKVIAYDKCDNQTKVPNFYKVIKRDGNKLYYELKK